MLSSVATILVSVISASASAGAVFYLLRKQSQSRSVPKNPDHEARYLFRGCDLMTVSGGGEWLFETAHGVGDTDWDQLRMVLLPRFPGFPAHPDQLDSDIMSFPAEIPGDDAEVLLEKINDMIRVTVLQSDGALMHAADLHLQMIANNGLGLFEQAVDNSPFPIWATDQKGAMLWANPAYLQLAGNVEIAEDTNLPALFPPPGTENHNGQRRRLSVALSDSDSNIWFDVTTTPAQSGHMHYAIDVNPVVRAEIAQRNFVQTLTKTFAQLSIGLVIFDRKRQLALFNPALTDLLHLPPEFLSARPTLTSFFDRLRDSRLMPEPKNYCSWREEVSDLILAASDGRYQEIWNLPNGLTYRVTGRPHPDGAIAFLFEDISSAISSSRRYRSQLDDLHAVLDKMPQAVACFSDSHTLSFANETYRTLWKCDPDVGVVLVSLDQAIMNWTGSCVPGTDFTPLSHRDHSPFTVTLKDGRQILCKSMPIAGGKFVVMFEQVSASMKYNVAIPA